MSQPHPDGIVTLRELYALLDKTRAEILTELQKFRGDVDKKFGDHEGMHDRESSRRTSLMRWAVTTIIAAIGVMVAIYVATKSGGG